jgi:hypothetical protein
MKGIRKEIFYGVSKIYDYSNSIKNTFRWISLAVCSQSLSFDFILQHENDFPYINHVWSPRTLKQSFTCLRYRNTDRNYSFGKPATASRIIRLCKPAGSDVDMSSEGIGPNFEQLSSLVSKTMTQVVNEKRWFQPFLVSPDSKSNIYLYASGCR